MWTQKNCDNKSTKNIYILNEVFKNKMHGNFPCIFFFEV
jgi:hypothetical protein